MSDERPQYFMNAAGAFSALVFLLSILKPAISFMQTCISVFGVLESAEQQVGGGDSLTMAGSGHDRPPGARPINCTPVVTADVRGLDRRASAS